jgi:hypothetical protein
VKCLGRLAQEIELIFPVHPGAEKHLKQYGLYQALVDTPNIHLIKSVGYLEMLVITKNAGKILMIPAVCKRKPMRKNIINAVISFEPNKKQHNIFGNGKAAEIICDCWSVNDSKWNY